MTQNVVEPIHSYHVQDSSNIGQSIRLPLSKGPSNLNMLLAQLYHISPKAYDAIKLNPAIINFFRSYPGLLQTLIRNPIMLKSFISSPIEGLSQLKKSNIDNNTLKADKSLAREQSKQVDPQKTNKAELKMPDQSIAKSDIMAVKYESVDLKPHRLPPEVIAKAHVESTSNSKIPVDIKFAYRSEIGKSGFLPHDQELQPSLITTARAFALNPDLLKMMSAQAVGINRTKKLSSTNEAEENGMEIDNSPSSDEENALKGVHKVDEIDPENKISQGHH